MSIYYGLEMMELNWIELMGVIEPELRCLYTQLSALSSKPWSKMHTVRASWVWLVPGSAPISLLCPGLCMSFTSRRPRFKQPGRLGITPVRKTLKSTGRAWKPLHEVPHHRTHCLTPVSLRNLTHSTEWREVTWETLSLSHSAFIQVLLPHPFWGLYFQGIPCNSWPRTRLAEPHHHRLIPLVFMGHQAMP